MSYRVVISIVLLLLSWGAAAQGPAIPGDFLHPRHPADLHRKVRGLPCLLRLRLSAQSGQWRGRGAWRDAKSRSTTASAARPRAPTRLFYDAFGKRAWQQKGFYSVLDAQGSQAALMARMLELGHKTPLQPNAKLPEDIVLGLNRENMCAMPAEFDGYAGAHPKEGMPLAVTGLTDQQYQTLQRWLASGAPIDEQGLAPSAQRSLAGGAVGKPAQRAGRPAKAWWGAGCSSTGFSRTSISRTASRGISSSGCVRARRPASRST